MEKSEESGCFQTLKMGLHGLYKSLVFIINILVQIKNEGEDATVKLCQHILFFLQCSHPTTLYEDYFLCLHWGNWVRTSLFSWKTAVLKSAQRVEGAVAGCVNDGALQIGRQLRKDYMSHSRGNLQANILLLNLEAMLGLEWLEVLTFSILFIYHKPQNLNWEF